MPDDTNILKRIGEEVASSLGEGPTEPRLHAQKRDLLSMVQAEPKPRRFRYVAMACTAAAALFIFGFLGLQWSEPKLQFWVGEHLDIGQEGDLIAHTTGQALPIRFEGGSRIELQNHTEARVAKSRHDSIDVELKKGKVAAQINGNGETEWVVKAGPYRVKVMGTVFSVSWKEEDSLLSVSVKRGSVLVSGSGLAERGVSLAAGDNLRVNDGKVIVTLESELSKPDDAFAQISKPLVEQEPEIETDPIPEIEQILETPEVQKDVKQNYSKIHSDKEETSPTQSWKDLFNDKDFAGAVQAAQEQGLDKLITNLDQEELWQLGKAARYSNNGSASTRVLVGIRERFSGNQKAQTATFLLGRVSLELKNDPNGARKWFKTYLGESPDGSLAEEALGRLIDACEKAGRLDEVRKHAKTYLARYPDGLFAELAQSALAE